jgi:hypothetical protein
MSWFGYNPLKVALMTTQKTANLFVAIGAAIFLLPNVGPYPLFASSGKAIAQEHDQGGGHEPGHDSGEHTGGQGSGRGKGGHHGGSGKRPPAHGHRSGVHGAAEEPLSGSEEGPASGRYRGTSHVPAAATGSAASRGSGHEGDTGQAPPVTGQGLANLNVIRSIIDRGEGHEDDGHEGGSESGDDHGDDHGEDDADLRNTLQLYHQEITKASGDPVVAGALLGSVARRPVTEDVVEKVNLLVGVSLPESDIATIAEAAEKGRQALRDDGRDDHGGRPPVTDPGNSQGGTDVASSSGNGFRLGRGEMANRRQCDDVAGRRMKSGERISGRNLARLKEINRFLWPGYEPAVGPSPIFILASFQEEIEKTAPDPVIAGTYLGLVSTRPIQPRTILEIASFLCASVTEQAAVSIAITAESQRQQVSADSGL